MSDWQLAQSDPSEDLAKLHYFSMKKKHAGGEVEFLITVKEYAERNAQHMRFFACADKQINQKTAPFYPFGWGESLFQALCECQKSIRKYPYEPE